MYAVSLAIERARESIWILDWWLSPELYLRRPPAKNQQYRVDRMLQAAAQRGVKVNIMVYKEVTQALTRKYLNPSLPDYLHSLLPRSTDPFTKGLTRIGLDVIFKSLEEIEKTDPLIKPPITVSSAHTKHALEALHPNIGVFRHPDHLPDAAVLGGSFVQSLQNMSFSPAKLAQLPGDSLKAVYGAHDGTVLYWAHHEKLCLIDGETAFMGGLDLCYGRWDTNQHPIADAHPGNLDRIVFPGQDFNNARILGKHLHLRTNFAKLTLVSSRLPGRSQLGEQQTRSNTKLAHGLVRCVPLDGRACCAGLEDALHPALELHLR
jgi:phospholipase D1/2